MLLLDEFSGLPPVPAGYGRRARHADWLRDVVLRVLATASAHGWRLRQPNQALRPLMKNGSTYLIFKRGAGNRRERVFVRLSDHGRELSTGRCELFALTHERGVAPPVGLLLARLRQPER